MADGSTHSLDFGHELVVDLFAGGGGASLGISRAYRDPDVAVNHNPIAIAVHQANHPDTLHYTCDVFEVDPVQATQGRPVAVLWASPDCRHHSKAKGGKPRSKKIRALAWVVVKWATACKPRLIHLENVEEFADWGPLREDGKPCLARKGATFRRWVRQLENLGYRVEWRELVAADYGAPTIRKRLYVIARCDGRPIVWPKPSHSKTAANGLPKWRAAAECIDWTIPANSIFDRKRPLAENTCRRIAKGTWRYVLTAAEPFIVKPNHTASYYDTFRGHGIGEPLQTVTQEPGFALAAPVLAPFLTEHANGSTQRTFDAQDPLRTQVAQVKGGHFALVSAAMIQTGYGERPGQAPRALDIQAPLGTVVAGGVKHAVVQAAFMEQAAGGPNSNGSRPRAMEEPVSTITASGSQQQLVQAYLVKFYSTGGQWQGCAEPMHTVPTKDRLGLVQVVQVPQGIIAPELLQRARQCAAFLHQYLPEHFPEPADLVLVGQYVLVDITLRMLAPRELARAQGFPADYVLERGAAGEPITKTDQVRLIGNSVCPDVAEALIRSNAADLIAHYQRAAA